MTPYELISNSAPDAVKRKADKAIAEGWSRRGYPAIHLNGDIPWGLANQNERSWNFYIHCWDMLDSLLATYSACGEERYLSPCIRIAIDWAQKYGAAPASQPSSPFAWYDMAVGLRGYRLAFIIDAARKAQYLSKSEDLLLWQALDNHRSYLADDSNIVFHNNHGYYQVAGQLAMGRRFREKSIEMAEAYSQGQERILLMLDQQFAADGVHKEHSPDYHRMVYDTLNGLIAAGLITEKRVVDFSKQIELALAWFVLPNQRLANFGDSDYRDMSRTAQEATRKWQTPEMRWEVSKGETGERDHRSLARFDLSGYFIYRSDNRQTYIAQTAAFHSRTHKHADDLSFIWFDNGSEILIDSGRYGYLGKTEQGSDLWNDGYWYSDPKRVYCESTRAHNCLEFDNKNYPRKGIKPYGSALGRSVLHSSGLIAVETECRHFNGNRHVRVLVLMPGKWLITFDWHHDNLKLSHNVKQWFHIAPEWHLEKNKQHFKASSRKTEKTIQIASFFPDTIASDIISSQSEPLYQGWWSPSEGQLLAADAFCYQQMNTSNGHIATIFSFSENLEIDTERSKTNTAGREIHLAWKDQQGKHNLVVARPADGDMTIIYNTHNS